MKKTLLGALSAALVVAGLMVAPGLAVAAAPGPHIVVYTVDNWVDAEGWPAGASLTLTIEDTGTQASPDYLAVALADGTGYHRFDLSASFDVQSGHEVTVTDATTPKTHVATSLLVTGTDGDTDTVTGTADPLSEVEVSTAAGQVVRIVNADASGNWVADFTPPQVGDPDYLLPGAQGLAQQVDADGDATRRVWSVGPAGGPPHFDVGVYVTGLPPGVAGYGFAPDTTVTITADDPTTQASPDASATVATDGVGNFSLQPTFAFLAKAGDLVTVTDGTSTKTHVVANVRVIAVNVATDTMTGSADPASSVHVGIGENPEGCGPSCVHRYVTADATGLWTANFGVPGGAPGDVGVLDLRVGSWSGSAHQRDADNDETQFAAVVGELTATPDAGLADGQSAAVNGFGWPGGETLYVTQCRIDQPLSLDTCDDSTIQSYTVGLGGEVTGTFPVARNLSTGAGPWDCGALADACGLVGMVWTGTPFVGFPTVLGWPENTVINFALEDDGVPDAVEDAAPNGGDGNADGTLDSEQGNVASLPSQVDGNPYVTIESPTGTTLSDVTTLPVPATPAPPPGASFPVGLVSFKVHVANPGDTAQVKVYLPAGSDVNSYFKLVAGVWVPLSGVSVTGDVMTLTLTDGVAPGDQDGLLDALITDPGTPTSLAGSRALTALSPTTVWVGLKSSDNQGARFDVRAQLLRNGQPVASGLARCVTDITRNPTLAKQVVVGWEPFAPVALADGDVLSMRVSTRIGTNANDTHCGGHSSAAGLRLYYDAAARQSRFDATISPAANALQYLHSDGAACKNAPSVGVTTKTTDATAPLAPANTEKCRDSAGINFKTGNAWQTIDTWTMP